MTVAQYRSPTGAIIVGLVRVVNVTSYIAGFEPDGTPVIEAEENEVDWASLRDKRPRGELLFEDENRQTWTYAELSRIDAECAPDL